MSSYARGYWLNRCNLAIDESMHHLGDMLVHQRAGAIRGVGLKSIKLGGPVTLLEAGCQA